MLIDRISMIFSCCFWCIFQRYSNPLVVLSFSFSGPFDLIHRHLLLILWLACLYLLYFVLEIIFSHSILSYPILSRYFAIFFDMHYSVCSMHIDRIGQMSQDQLLNLVLRFHLRRFSDNLKDKNMHTILINNPDQEI